MPKILFIGDIISRQGCELVRELLPQYKKNQDIDVVIANGENSAVGNGILPSSADSLFTSGVDVITTGNHVYRRREIYSYFESRPELIRPANYPDGSPGNGYYVYDGGSFTLLVINLLGVAFLEPLDNPFRKVEEIIAKNKATFTVVDFHAESTGEKKALGFFLDGKATMVVGTHTHVQTADEMILPKGTGYITDLGMTGPINSVIGAVPEQSIARFKTSMPTRLEIAEGECKLEGVICCADRKSGLCSGVERVSLVR